MMFQGKNTVNVQQILGQLRRCGEPQEITSDWFYLSGDTNVHIQIQFTLWPAGQHYLNVFLNDYKSNLNIFLTFVSSEYKKVLHGGTGVGIDNRGYLSYSQESWILNIVTNSHKIQIKKFTKIIDPIKSQVKFSSVQV